MTAVAVEALTILQMLMHTIQDACAKNTHFLHTTFRKL
jgi:hypothetical protein